MTMIPDSSGPGERPVQVHAMVPMAIAGAWRPGSQATSDAGGLRPHLRRLDGGRHLRVPGGGAGLQPLAGSMWESPSQSPWMGQ